MPDVEAASDGAQCTSNCSQHVQLSEDLIDVLVCDLNSLKSDLKSREMLESETSRDWRSQAQGSGLIRGQSHFFCTATIEPLGPCTIDFGALRSLRKAKIECCRSEGATL